jgi:putative modified peptide
MSIAFEERCVAESTETYSPEAGLTTRNAFSAEVADKLLEKLATDDTFRELFQSNPRAALQQVGHETPAQQVGIRGFDPVMCANLKNGLASKEAIRAGRESMKAALVSTQQHSIFNLSAG